MKRAGRVLRVPFCIWNGNQHVPGVSHSRCIRSRARPRLLLPRAARACLGAGWLRGERRLWQPPRRRLRRRPPRALRRRHHRRRRRPGKDQAPRRHALDPVFRRVRRRAHQVDLARVPLPAHQRAAPVHAPRRRPQDQARRRGVEARPSGGRSRRRPLGVSDRCRRAVRSCKDGRQAARGAGCPCRRRHARRRAHRRARVRQRDA